MATSVKKKREQLPLKKSTAGLKKEVYRKKIADSPKKVSITLPETLVGKTVEVFAFEIFADRPMKSSNEKPFSKKDFWDTFGSGKNSLINVKDIRAKAWRKHSW